MSRSELFLVAFVAALVVVPLVDYVTTKVGFGVIGG